MIKTFNINGTQVAINVLATKEFYKTQKNISEDCDCSDCSYYQNIFTNKSFAFFDILTKMGVDIKKNLSSEPTGVWCIRNESNNIIHVTNYHHVIGNITQSKQVECSIVEHKLNFNLFFRQIEENIIDIELSIDSTSNKN